ncbi:MAG: selenium-dependent xanthine dehydrogenase [bacterium]
MGTQSVKFILNDAAVEADCESDESLLDVLRNRFGITSPKNACQPMGHCGCCTILIGGRPVLSCVTPAVKAAGREVTTLEGFSAIYREAVSQSFVAAGALQCGFCTAGIAVRAKALLDRNPNPSRDEIKRALVPHLCRCTGYVKIIRGIELTARHLRGESVPEPDYSGRIGSPLPRYEGAAMVLGERRFTDDISVGDMVHGAPVFSAHPRAIIKSIGTRNASGAPGVIAVLLAEDIPGERFQGLITPDWPVMIAGGGTTRYIGDILAVVVGETARAARKAAQLVDVQYEILRPVASAMEALEPDAPILHPRIRPRDNILSRSRITRGEKPDAVFPSCAFIVEETFHTQRIEHAFLEPESAVALPWRDGVMEVMTPGQGVFDDQRQIASILGVEPARIRCALIPNGGAFGGKEDLGTQGLAALIAHKTGRPAKVTLTREESMRFHPKRHPMTLHYKVGCDASGRLLAVKARIIGDNGAYASVGGKVLERAGGHASGPYTVPNLDVEALAVYTNNPPSGAMRGFGVNQTAFSIEGCLDRLAEMAGIDRWEIRWRNAMDTGSVFCSGQVFDKPVGLKQTLLATRDAFRGAKYAGIACGIKNVGIGNGMPDAGQAVIRVDDDGEHLEIFTGFTEMGQGLFTLLIQSVIEIIPHLDSRKFRVRADTTRPVPCGMTTASRATILGCLAAKHAAEALKAGLDAGRALADLAGREFFGEVCFDDTVPLGRLEGKNGGPVKTHVTFGFATQVVILNDDGTLKKIIAAHDVGRVMNPILLEGQIEGAVHMGLGYALTEDMIWEGGYLKSKRLNDLGILRAHHMPEVECVFIEAADPDCPWGAKGVGEIGLVPTAPAVAGALHAFDGKWRNTLPMKDSAAARKIMGKQALG